MPTSRPVGDLFAWMRALRGSGVSARALGLAFVLASRMNGDGTIPTRFAPSSDTLANDLGYAKGGRKSVDTLARELEAAGFLEVRRGGGRHVVNQYVATVPAAGGCEEAATETDPVQDQYEAETDPIRTRYRSQTGAHPSPPTQSPSPSRAPAAQRSTRPEGRDGSGTPKAKKNPTRDVQPTEQERADATRVVQAVWERLYAGYGKDAAEATSRSLAGHTNRDLLAQRIGRLVALGWEDVVVDELTAKTKPWAQWPYARADDPSAVIAGRVKALGERLTEPRVDPSEYVPTMRTTADVLA